MKQPNKPCEYVNDYKRCPRNNRIFICNTELYRHCNTYQLLSRQDRHREREGLKEIVEGKGND